MKGTVNSDLEAIIRLTVRDRGGADMELDALVDTGFNGFLTLPATIVEELRLPYLYRQEGELADGSLHVFDVYAAVVLWDGVERTVEVDVADADPLLGMALMAKNLLSIEVMAGGKVSTEKLT
jgi:clan AA aspartic protease